MTSRFCFLCLINIYLIRLLVETNPRRNIIHNNSFPQLSALNALFRFLEPLAFLFQFTLAIFINPTSSSSHAVLTNLLYAVYWAPTGRKKSLNPNFFTPTRCCWVPIYTSRWSCRGWWLKSSPVNWDNPSSPSSVATGHFQNAAFSCGDFSWVTMATGLPGMITMLFAMCLMEKEKHWSSVLSIKSSKEERQLLYKPAPSTA